MSESTDAGGKGPSHRTVELGVAAFTALLAIIVIAGSLRVGIGWAVEGPRAGFFPFCIGVIMFGASLLNLARAFGGHHHRVFAGWNQIRQVVAVAIPTGIYVFLISGVPAILGVGFPAGFLATDRSMLVPGLGIYLASAILIAGFMKVLGRYRWPLTLAVSIALPVLIYLTFERWFLVSLPKGPIEGLLGL
ncbi:MAG: tripartite tricarboxylate transporter TctB family protein [Bauldia sp.]